MKKLLCMMMVLVLCLSGVASAESVPSKTTDDMVRVEEVQVENLPENAPAPVLTIVTLNTVPKSTPAPTTSLAPGASVSPVSTPAPTLSPEEEALAQAYQEKLEVCNREVQKLVESKSVEKYFGEVKTVDGEKVKLEKILDTKKDNLKVDEFVPIVATNYQPSYGAVTTTVTFSTPYAKDEKVVVLIGIVKVNADGTETVEWVALEGVGVDAPESNIIGGVQMVLPPELMMAIQEGTAMMTVVSDADAAELRPGNNGAGNNGNGTQTNGQGAENRNENAENRGNNGPRK